ncbi:hypothetical protein [Vitiosangium sp. GDMCC 1.1324]|uniref:hypothetical protein n=1 Tax=Vitiosangium sp. (strain GDMCC 1.1324) TaxID=2138576 RepID=UPI000D3D8E45|nr:hypothetical protein [Vitiosangium sp. GDMCC 1.1324]PTL85376.1 hypothetical protein DAT35_01260 [Vitiosangium sp. GDMCC 1.1324]
MAADDVRRSETPEENGLDDAPELETISSQMAYDAFLTAAKAIEPGLIEECCADVVLTYHTVMRGVESVVGSGAVLVGKLPNVNVEELSMLPRLAQGLAFAALQVQRELQSASFGMLFERAQLLRRKLRKAADALAEANLLAEADIDEVRLQAPRELLEDCLALAALLRRNEARIAGRSPVTAPDIREAEQVAEKLRTLLGQQGDASDGGTPSLVKVIEMRDRFWTLLNQRHDMLWRCGAWLFGRAVDERVPPLPIRQSVVRKPRNAPPEREAMRKVAEPRRSVSPPAIVPARVSPPAIVPVRESARHLGDLQRDLERKTRFLIRIGVIPSQR